MGGGEDGEKVVFGGLDGAFGGEGTMLVGCGESDGDVIEFEEVTKGLGRFVVDVHVCDRVVVFLIESNNVGERGAVGGR